MSEISVGRDVPVILIYDPANPDEADSWVT